MCLADLIDHQTQAVLFEELDKQIQVLEVCPFCPEMERIVVWNNQTLTRFQKYGSLCCHPLRNQRLTVSYIGVPPFIVYSDPITGVDVEVIKILAHRFGFNITWKPETIAGKFNARRWTGMVENVSHWHF